MVATADGGGRDRNQIGAQDGRERRPPQRGAEPRGLEVVQERWDFYRDEARSWKDEVRWWRLTAVIAVLLTPLAFFAGREPAHVIGIDAQGHAIRIPDLSDRAVSDAAVRRFCAESVSEIGTFGYHDLTLRFAAMQGRFTPLGWRRYNDAVMAQRIPESVKRYEQTYATTPEGPCAILDQTVTGGRYWWQVRVDVVRRVASGSRHEDFHLHIDMEIVRVGVSEANEMIAIDRWRE